MNTSTQNKNNKGLIIIILIVVAAIVLSGVGFIVIRKYIRDSVDTSANVTLIKCNAGKALDDEILKELEEACKARIGDKFIKVEKREGMDPVLGLPTNENGDELISSVGDGLTVTCRLLTEGEKMDMITDISKKLNFIHDYGMEFENTVYQIEIKDVYRGDIK